MKKIIVLMHPSRKVAHVKVGFSWPAFLLGPLWAFVKRLWWHFLALILVLKMVNFATYYALSTESLFSLFLDIGISLTYMLVCGIYGNRWLMKALLKRGYVVVN
ncbi:DUF2628 domain-containing protein [Herbaspirillum sp. CF444]|uniref:DUF2628 domain-containing protein n=1 Tax=Herbaspirillum sp. CF444 TaxID=1144319 RepID=UPI00031CC8E5|nr:DUF2628 domain-containing protein [Herbaspirillum sp. CF444]